THIAARAAQAIDWSDTLELVPHITGITRSNALALAAGDMGLEANVATDHLREAFRWDRGEVVNLSLLYLGHNADVESPSEDFLTKLRAAVAKLDAKARPEAVALRAALDAHTDRAALPLAPVVDILPGALGRDRTEAFAIVCDRMNRGRPDKERLSDGEVSAELWKRYRDNPHVINNLALEYLAEDTNLVARRVAEMTFDKPVEELPEKAGIGRTESFVALSCARGASDTEVLTALAALNMDTTSPDVRPYVYLAQLDHRRYNAIARRDWENFKPFLKQLIEGDAAATRVVQEKMVTSKAVDYGELAKKQSIILAALAAKDWKRAPEQAGELLELNPYEARHLMAAELDGTLVSTTRLLWEKYKPQYHVWLPFAAVGVVATIALAIFGHMAKRWTDMNA
ncbi:MAG TPA: hypothetical protein P5572_11675, partial [Phycisphaerae bacterium]|nr:hypothetical protein [Phycisphaerae bacterium]